MLLLIFIMGITLVRLKKRLATIIEIDAPFAALRTNISSFNKTKIQQGVKNDGA